MSNWFQKLIGSTSGNVAEVDSTNHLKVVNDVGIQIGSAAQLAASPAIVAQNRPDQALRVSMDYHSLFFDGFDSFDTQDKWLANAGASVIPTVANGQMTINPGTTLSAWTMIRSQPAFPNPATSYLNPGFVVKIDSTISTKNYRFWGLGTTPATPTLAAPMTDGVGFEILTTGELQAVVWANGTKVFSALLTRPSDTQYHRYSVYYKSSRVYWMYDSQDLYVATATTSSAGYTPPVIQTLPLLMLSVNDPTTAPTVNAVAATAPTFILAAVILADTGRNGCAISDGIFGWRKARIGEAATADEGSLHVVTKPIPTSIGAYRVNHKCALVAVQAANSRLFEIRNSHATNLIVPTRLTIRWLQTAAHTAAIENSLDVFKVTGFTVLDTVNTVTPVGSLRRASMTAFPGSLQIRGNTIAGAAAGMTGGTLTKDGGSVGQLPQWLLLAMPTAGTLLFQTIDVFDDVNGTHPFVLAQNEGLIIENRVLLGAAAGSDVYIDLSWTEVIAY